MSKLKTIVLSVGVLFFALSFGYSQAKATVKTEIESFDQHGNANLKIESKFFSAKGFGASDIVVVSVGKNKITAPICRDYSDVDNGQYLVRMNGEEVSLAINKGNFQTETKTKVGDDVSISLKTQRGYLLTYQKRVLKKSNNREDFTSDEVFANFRTVSGGRITANKLYRSSNPAVDETRAPYAAKLMENANVSFIIDLANTKEDALPFIEQNPYLKKLNDNGKILFLNMGVSYKDADFIKKLQSALKFMAYNPNETFCICGKEGRTRTGFVCAVLEAACGASANQITDDYMKSFENLNGTKKGTTQYEDLSQSVSEIFQDITGKKISDKTSESLTKNYLTKTVGLTNSEVENLVKSLN